MLALAFCVDPAQWRELDWRVEVVALVALCHVGHLTDYSVLMAALTALKVAHPHSDLLANGNGIVPLLATATL